MKIFKRISLAVLALVVVAIGIWIYIYRDSIFKYGNPMPYIARIVLLSDKTTFLQVSENPTTYVTKKDNHETMFKTFTEKRRLTLKSHEGDNYLYDSIEATFTIYGSIYFRDYMVWTVNVMDKDEPTPLR